MFHIFTIIENIIPKLLDLNAIDVLKQHVNPDNLYALFTIANISRNSKI